MDPLDELELRVFEHIGCTGCAEQARGYVEAALDAGRIDAEDLRDLEIVVKEPGAHDDDEG